MGPKIACFALLLTGSMALRIQEQTLQEEGGFPEDLGSWGSQKTILLAEIDNDFVKSGLFRNWFRHAAPFFSGRSVELVFDSNSDTNVDNYLRSFDFGNVAYKTITDVMPSSAPANFVEADPYGSKSYKALMNRRPHAMKRMLEDGNFVFQFDLDTAWVKNPFTKFDEAGNHDILATSDGTANNLCGCLLYVRPSERTVKMMADWIEAIQDGDAGNQDGFNRVVAANREEKKVDVSILELGDFPPGNKANKFPNATIFHANWVLGIPAKVKFFKKRHLWIEE